MRTTPIGHKCDPHHPDVEGQQVVLASDFDICKKQGHDILTDYEKEHALRLEAERQVGKLREQLAKEAVWGRFAGWLLDHCEGQEIYEERLQYWLSEMLAHEKATSTEGKDHE